MLNARIVEVEYATPTGENVERKQANQSNSEKSVGQVVLASLEFL